MKRILIAVLTACALAAGAAEWKSAEWNCSVEYPAGWNQIESPSPIIKAAFQNAAIGETMVVMIVENVGADVGMNDEFIAGVRGGFTRQGGTIVSERRCEMAGLPAFEMVGKTSGQGNEVSLMMRSVIADGKAYTVQIMNNKGNVATDAELVRTLDTFRFLHAPAPPLTPGTVPKSAAYRLGYQMAKIARWSVVGAVVGGVIGVIGYLIVKSRSGKKSSGPPPPPVPRG